MGRKLKFHEQKLLRKTNLYSWKHDDNQRVGMVVSRYGLSGSDEYNRYNRLVMKIQKFTNTLRQMPPEDKVRIDLTREFVDRVYKLGFIESPLLSECENISASSVCKRRRPVVLCQLKFCQRVSDADRYVRQGHIRIGPDVVTNPATIVSKEQEDFIAWAHESKIRQHVAEYNEQRDDYELQQ